MVNQRFPSLLVDIFTFLSNQHMIHQFKQGAARLPAKLNVLLEMKTAVAFGLPC
jgi:hypothetical protein